MNELYNLIDDFKKALSEEDTVKELTTTYKKIYKDKKLIEQIKDYKENKNYLIKDEINKNENYLKVKHLEAKLGYMILEINKRLKEIIKDEEKNESDKW